MQISHQATYTCIAINDNIFILVHISIWLVQLAANEIKIENASNIICISFALIKSVIGTLNPGLPSYPATQLAIIFFPVDFQQQQGKLFRV